MDTKKTTTARPAGTTRTAKPAEELTVRTRVSAGGVRFNHSEALEVRTEVRAGADRLSMNDSEVLEVRTEVRAGAMTYNHSQAPVVVPIGVNHSQTVAIAGSRG